MEMLWKGAELLTMAKPDSRAEVRLVAFSFARLRYSFRQDRACKDSSLPLIVHTKDTNTQIRSKVIN